MLGVVTHYILNFAGKLTKAYYFNPNCVNEAEKQGRDILGLKT